MFGHATRTRSMLMQHHLSVRHIPCPLFFQHPNQVNSLGERARQRPSGFRKTPTRRTSPAPAISASHSGAISRSSWRKRTTKNLPSTSWRKSNARNDARGSFDSKRSCPPWHAAPSKTREPPTAGKQWRLSESFGGTPPTTNLGCPIQLFNQDPRRAVFDASVRSDQMDHTPFRFLFSKSTRGLRRPFGGDR